MTGWGQSDRHTLTLDQKLKGSTKQRVRGGGIEIAGAGSASVMALGAISLVVVVAFVGALVAIGDASETGGGEGGSTIEVLCAAGIRPVVERAADQFEDETGVAVRVQYGGSGSLLATIQVSGRGDLYIAADGSFVRTAEARGLVVEAVTLARMVPVIAVAEGNPKDVRTLGDLLRKDVEFAMANPSAAAIGNVTKAAMVELGQWDAIKEACRVFKPTVNDVAADVKLGTVDAGIVWDATATQMSGIEGVRVPDFDGLIGIVEAGVLASSKHREAAAAFARYLAASDRGGLTFDKLGYGGIEREVWLVEEGQGVGG